MSQMRTAKTGKCCIPPEILVDEDNPHRVQTYIKDAGDENEDWQNDPGVGDRIENAGITPRKASALKNEEIWYHNDRRRAGECTHLRVGHIGLVKTISKVSQILRSFS